MTGTVIDFQDKTTQILVPAKVKWFRHKLAIWATENLREFPWRCTTEPYKIFIAEFFLQKTGAITVEPI